MLKFTFSILATLTFLASHPEVSSANLESGLYELETQTLLPHLDEMRRNITTTTVCLKNDGLKQLFPILAQPGLKDCFFRRHTTEKDTTFFLLQCPGLNGAQGRATLQEQGNRLKASLDAKLGGKNMTFSQTTKAKRLGVCSPAQL